MIEILELAEKEGFEIRRCTKTDWREADSFIINGYLVRINEKYGYNGAYEVKKDFEQKAFIPIDNNSNAELQVINVIKENK